MKRAGNVNDVAARLMVTAPLFQLVDAKLPERCDQIPVIHPENKTP